MWLLTPAQLAECGVAHDKDVYIVRLKPTVHSHTHKREGVIPGTEKLRLRATAVMWEWLREAGIDVPVHHVGEDFYVIDKVDHPNLEFIGKAAHVGTPKHKLVGIEDIATRDGARLTPDQSHPEYTRIDYRNQEHDPATGRPLPDECIPEDLADRFVDARVAKRTTWNAFRVLRDRLGKLGIDLQDICFFISRDGLSIFSEVSPDGMRAKWNGHDGDKDAFRKGESADSVVDAYALLLGLLEGESRPESATAKRDLIQRVKARHGLPSLAL
jgi:phosphoribosylaminoimidazole-succinocarboxamide synthase